MEKEYEAILIVEGKQEADTPQYEKIVEIIDWFEKRNLNVIETPVNRRVKHLPHNIVMCGGHVDVCLQYRFYTLVGCLFYPNLTTSVQTSSNFYFSLDSCFQGLFNTCNKEEIFEKLKGYASSFPIVIDVGKKGKIKRIIFRPEYRVKRNGEDVNYYIKPLRASIGESPINTPPEGFFFQSFLNEIIDPSSLEEVGENEPFISVTLNIFDDVNSLLTNLSQKLFQ